MDKLIRFGAARLHGGGFAVGANIWCHKHGSIGPHLLFVIDVGFWYIEMEVGHEPQD